MVQGTKQETNTGSKPKMPDHYRCTITCAFCGKCKHYEDECYHKQRLSAKLKGEDPGKGSGKGGGRDKNDCGKGKSKGRRKAQDKSQGGRGEDADRQQDKDNKNQDNPEATPTLIQGGTPSPLEGSLVPGRPHARRLRTNKSKGPSEDMKVVTMCHMLVLGCI